MNLAGRNLQAAPLDWAELMSQKIPQPGLQGSPWASGETGSSRTGGRMRCVSWGAFCRLLNEQGRLLRIRLGIGGWNSHKDSKEERASEVCVTGWSRDYPALICKPWLYQGVLGTSTLSQVHSVHQAAANPPPSCPQGVKCAPNPFHTRPITQQTYSRRRTGKGTDRQHGQSCSHTDSIWCLQKHNNYWLTFRGTVTHCGKVYQLSCWELDEK